MVKLRGEFDATRVEPSQAFDTIPAGKYLVMATDSDVRSTKGGDGTYLWFEFDILDGDYKGRKLWARINQENPKQQAVDIGQREFSSLCHAAGKLHVSDTIELHDIPVIAHVRVRPAEGQYDASNEIRGYSPAGGVRPATASATAPTSAQASIPLPAQAPPASAPWKRARG